MLDPHQFVRSLTRGRARIRHEVLKGLTQTDIDGLTQMILGTEGVTSVTFNPRVGSALILWDETKTNAETLLGMAAFFLPEEAEAPAECAECAECSETTECTQAQEASCPCCEKVRSVAATGLSTLRSAADAVLDRARPFVAPDVTAGGRGKRVTQNRLMLATCVASVVVLFTRNAALHTVLGGLFCGLLAVHLLQHRTVL